MSERDPRRGHGRATVLDIRVSNGQIDVNGIRESGKLRTSNGRIVLDGVAGEFDVDTSNGGVTIRDATGEFEANTSNGAIDFNGELTPGGRNRMTTSNGSIEVVFQGEASVIVDASTSRGRVRSELPVTATLTEEDRLVGTIGDGEADLFIDTSNGSITIR